MHPPTPVLPPVDGLALAVPSRDQGPRTAATRPRGLQVAVLGPDGSGKSTLIEGLARALAPAFTGVAVRHFRPGLADRRGTGLPVTDPHGREPRSAAASVLKLGFYVFDHVLGYALGTVPRCARGELVLYDRHFADLAVDPRRYRYGGPAGLPERLLRLIPPPDLTLILDAPVHVVRQRAAEVSAEEGRRQREAYRRLASRTSNAFLLDADRPPQEVLKDAVAHVHARRAQSRPSGNRL